jgi:hypothetical protein
VGGLFYPDKSGKYGLVSGVFGAFGLRLLLLVAQVTDFLAEFAGDFLAAVHGLGESLGGGVFALLQFLFEIECHVVFLLYYSIFSSFQDVRSNKAAGGGQPCTALIIGNPELSGKGADLFENSD